MPVVNCEVHILASPLKASSQLCFGKNRLDTSNTTLKTFYFHSVADGSVRYIEVHKFCNLTVRHSLMPRVLRNKSKDLLASFFGKGSGMSGQHVRGFWLFCKVLNLPLWESQMRSNIFQILAQIELSMNLNALFVTCVCGHSEQIFGNFWQII